MRCLLGIAILAAIAANIDFARLGQIWRPVVLVYLGGAALILVAAQLVSAARWKLLLTDDDVSWMFLTRLYLIGNFFSAFLPTSIGGDAVRTGALAREGIPLRRSVASVLFDRLLGVAGMAPIFAAGALLVAMDPVALFDTVTFEMSPGEVTAAVGVALALAGGAFLFFRQRVRAKIEQFADELQDLAGRPAKLTVLLVLGVVVQAMYVCAWRLLVPATGLDFGWAMLLFGVPVVSIAAMLPVSIAGLEVREGVWIVLLGGSFAAADVVVFSLLYFVAYSLAGAVGGILYMIQGISARDPQESVGKVNVPETVAS